MKISAISEQPHLASWAPTFDTQNTEDYTRHEGVYYSPHGTVHCISERSTGGPLPGTNVQERTQLRMVFGGQGKQATEFEYVDLGKLPIVASAFARRVAAEAGTTTPTATNPEEPDYLTPIDAYAGQALSGLLAAGAYPDKTAQLATTAFALGAAMVRQRAAYFRAYPVGTVPDEAATKY